MSREAFRAESAQARPLSLPVLSMAEAQPLRIEGMRPVGNYAYNIAFSDGHDSGIFTFEYLRELGRGLMLLCIETTCDETAAAIIDRQRNVLSAAVASQEEIHQRFQGVVPELAARAHLERIVPIIQARDRTS